MELQTFVTREFENIKDLATSKSIMSRLAGTQKSLIVCRLAALALEHAPHGTHEVLEGEKPCRCSKCEYYREVVKLKEDFLKIH